MFGLRLVRAADHDALRADLVAAREEIAVLNDKLIQQATATGAALSRADVLTARTNALEVEAAHVRNHTTGLPAVATRIEQHGVGRPILSHAMADGVDRQLGTFDDVGDERAGELREKGLLHDDAEHELEPVGAADTLKGAGL